MYSCKINSLNSLSLYSSESKYLLMIMIIQLLSFVFNLTLLKYCSVNKKPNSIINTLPNTNKVFLFIRNYANEDQFFWLLTLNSKQRSLFDFLWLLKLKKIEHFGLIHDAHEYIDRGGVVSLQLLVCTGWFRHVFWLQERQGFFLVNCGFEMYFNQIKINVIVRCYICIHV